MRTKKFFATRKEGEREIERRRKAGKDVRNLSVYDLKKTHPRRKKTRFLVGNYFDYLGL